MAFIAQFSTSQTLGNSAIINFMDTSTGSDSAIISRQIFLTQASGAPLVPAGNNTNFISWPLINNPLPVNVLTQDFALLVQVNWLAVDGSVLYTVSQVYCYTNYGESFLYSLTQNQAAQPSLLADTNYLNNKYLVRVYIDSANNAILFGSDTAASQNCIDAYTKIIQDQNTNF